MTTPLDDRLQLERMLLAALFMYPRSVELDMHHFVAPAHAAFFCALDDGKGEHWPGGLKLVARRIAQQPGGLKTFNSVGGVKKFVNEVLPLEMVKPSFVDVLAGEVRKCPRCGR